MSNQKIWVIRSAEMYDNPVLGEYQGSIKMDALDAMAKESRRSDYAALCLVYGRDPADWREKSKPVR